MVSMDRISQARLVTGWLADKAADHIMAECDAATGHAPRALVYLPQDSLWSALQRFFRWDGRPVP